LSDPVPVPKRFSRAHLAAAVAFGAASLLAPFGAAAAAPLLLFCVLCGAAPFFPSWRFFLPIATRGSRTSRKVALTFDDGPNPATTPRLLELLARHGVRATFFVVGKRVEAEPGLLEAIRRAGHEVGNHSYSHDPFLMLRSTSVLRREVADCQRLLKSLGVRPLSFRPPVGITNPRLGPVLRELGLACVGFSCRPVDFGNRRIDALARAVERRARGGDVILLHDCEPHEQPAQRWLDEIDRLIAALRAARLEMVPLSELLGFPVMLPSADHAKAPDPPLAAPPVARASTVPVEQRNIVC
jgi:peptidoglycan/xylan/chitin deacetylase (PgdA/CDA1 family)